MKYPEINVENKIDTPLSSHCRLFNKNVPDNQQSFICIQAMNGVCMNVCSATVLLFLFIHAVTTANQHSPSCLISKGMYLYNSLFLFSSV